MKKNKLGKVLFCGRKNCKISKKAQQFIKKKSSKFYFIESNKVGEKIPQKITKMRFDYVFCFRSFFILKKNFLAKVKNVSINFHPSPPKFRGAGGINYSLFNKLKYFATTAHIMNEKIDYGDIIDVKKLPITRKDNIETVLSKTHKISFKQIKYIINQILKSPNNLDKLIKKNKNLKWSKKYNSVDTLNKFYEIKLNVTKKSFFRKIHATNTTKFKPYIILYGKKFVLE